MSNWENVERVVAVLECFNDASELLGASAPTASLLPLVLSKLFKCLIIERESSERRGDSEIVSRFKTELSHRLDEVAWLFLCCVLSWKCWRTQVD